MAGSSWPAIMMVEGDTVTFVFSANSRADKNQGAGRWGFRCLVIDTRVAKKETLHVDQDRAALHWLLVLENALAHITGKCISALVEGDPITEKEKAASVWLEDELMNGGLDEEVTSKKSDKKALADLFVDTVAEGRGEGDILFRWIQRQAKGRPMIPPNAAVFVDKAERLVVAAMLKHLGLSYDAKVFAHELAEGKQPDPADTSALKLAHIGTFSGKVAKWITFRGQVEKEWQTAVEEKQKDTDLFSRFQGKATALQRTGNSKTGQSHWPICPL